MHACKKCGDKIPNRLVIDGKQRFLCKRKFCTKCSPFGSHNTKADPSLPARRPRSYSQYPPELRRKHSRELLARAHKLKTKLVTMFGGKCSVCAYDRCQKALQFHHLDPSTKLFGLAASNLRARKWEDVLAEAKKCVLLCANCHIEEEHRLDVLAGADCSG